MTGSEQINTDWTPTRVDGKFATFAERLMLEDEFPFNNLKLFIEIGGYTLYKLYKEAKDKNNPQSLKDFSHEMEKIKNEMIRKGLMYEKTKGWKR